MKQHHYQIKVTWTGNLGSGTNHYAAYNRNHLIEAPDKEAIAGSSDPAFRGDPTRYNPEELLVSTLSSCHMLWYLHLCAEAGVVVLSYEDQTEGIMQEEKNGSGRFVEVVLKPAVTVADSAMLTQAQNLHHRAHQMCFIANSVNFPVRIEATVQTLVPSQF